MDDQLRLRHSRKISVSCYEQELFDVQDDPSIRIEMQSSKHEQKLQKSLVRFVVCLLVLDARIDEDKIGP